MDIQKTIFRWYKFQDKNQRISIILNEYLQRCILQIYNTENTIDNRAESYFLKEQYNQAIDILKHNLSLDQDHTVSIYFISLCLFKLKHYMDALRYFIKIESEDEKYKIRDYIGQCRSFLKWSISQYFREAHAFAKDGEYYKAISLYDDILLVEPQNPEAFMDKGLALEELNDNEGAIIYYDKALKSRPRYKDAYKNKGRLLEKLNRYSEAVAVYDMVLDLDPRDTSVLNDKGNIFEKLKRYDESLICYDKVIEINSQHFKAYSNKSIVLKELKKYDEAISCLYKAIELNPEFIAAYNNLAFILAELERYDEAIELYNKAIEKDKNCIRVYLNKADALKADFRIKEAVDCYHRVLTLDPTNEEAISKLNQIH
jgi:tetratricopeptide (TPR) repeat protein